MFLVGTVGILWYILYSATSLGFNSFPKNYMQRAQELSSFYFIVNHGGQLFGMNLIFLAAAYRTVTAMLEYTNFRPVLQKTQ